MSRKRTFLAALIVVSQASGVALGQSESDPRQSVIQLSPTLVIGMHGELFRPLAVQEDQSGFIYILDSGESRVVVHTPDGARVHAFGEEGSERGQFLAPMDLAIDAESRVYVADAGNKRIEVFASNGELLSEIPLGFRNISIDVSPDGVIYSPTDPEEITDLIQVYRVNGKPDGSLGKMLEDRQQRRGMRTALNRYYMDTSDSLVLIARQAIPMVDLYEKKTGELLARFELRTEEITATREQFFRSVSSQLEKNGRSLTPHPTHDDFVRDIEATIVGGNRPYYVQYIAGAEIYNGEIYLLLNGAIVKVDRDGNVLEKITTRGSEGEEIYNHRMWISDRGALYTIDKAHFHRVYQFWI